MVKKEIPRIPPISSVHPYVTRVLGQNPGPMTLQGTNSYLVGTPGSPRVLIDTTENDPEKLKLYITILEAEFEKTSSQITTPCSPIASIWLTHWHPDHAGGVDAIQDFLCKQSPSTPPALVYKLPGGPNLRDIGYFSGAVRDLVDRVEIPVGDSLLMSLMPLFTPGHTVDHACVALIVEGNVECIFVGDLLLGHGTTLVLDLGAYMHSLDVLKEFVMNCGNPGLCFLPAHGEVIVDPIGKIDEYISHRKKRVSQVKEALLQAEPDSWVKESVLLEAVYPGIAHNLKLPAVNNLRQSLFWLQTHNCSSIYIPAPVTCDATPEVRGETAYKAATAVLRPEHIPKVFHEEWQWMWTQTP